MNLRALRICLLASLAIIPACGNSSNNGTGAGMCTSGLFPGDLVITEVMANPNATDTGNEWFEIYNPSDKPRTLGSLQVTSSKADGSAAKSHVISALTIAPRSYVALGDVAEAARPSWITYSYGKDFGGGLQNTGGALTLRCNDKVIDKVTWETATSAKSRGFDGAVAPDAIANDDVMKWCDASSDGSPDFKGTPGKANDKCDAVTGTMKGFCNDPMTGKPRGVPTLAAGDLVISEIMADPITPDADSEWIEVTATKEVIINELTVGTVEDPAKLKPVVAGTNDCITLAAGQRAVLVRSIDAMKNGGIQPSATTLGLPVDLTNSGAVVAIGSGTTLVDLVPSLGTAKAGVSHALHPLHMIATDNDEPRFWCDGAMSYGPGGAGTPGGENPACNIRPAPGNCRDAGMERAIVGPAVGDLVISEVMGNPITDEASSEWIEITATKQVDLAGLAVGNDADATLLKAVPEAAAGDCLTLGAGERAVLVKSLDVMKNGGVTPGPRVLTLPGISLGNTMPFTLAIGTGAVLVDVIPMTPAANKSGLSLALDPMHLTAVDNDVVRFWCDGTVAYGPGGSGTPGGVNAACDIPPAPGMCRDGGVERPLVSPVVGDLVINELMADPSLAADADGEWFELAVKADVDLNGIVFGSSKTQTLATGQCLRVKKGDHVVFARSTDPMLNGGLMGLQPWQAITGGTFVNGGGTITLAFGMTPLDTLTWPAAKPGIAYSHDPNPPNAWCNLDPAKHMNELFNGKDYGTPGAVNTSCP